MSKPVNNANTGQRIRLVQFFLFAFAFTWVLLPLTDTSIAFSLAALCGPAIQLQSVSTLSLIVFVLVAGEEIGWRGYALPKLIESYGVATGTLTLGVLWALWHLPLFVMPNMPQFGMPFIAFNIYTIALSTILTYLFIKGTGSVPLVAIHDQGSLACCFSPTERFASAGSASPSN